MVKKVLCIILIFSLGVVPTGCNGEEHTYIIPERRCVAMFGCTPDVALESIDESYWIQGEYVSAEVDEEGNLVLVLNDKNIRHWKKELQEGIETKYNADKRDGEGYGFEYDETYSAITDHTDRKIYGGVVIAFGFLIPEFGIMQMLNGTDPSQWYVDITVKDVETGTTIKTGRMPDDVSFELNREDWEKTLGPEE